MREKSIVLFDGVCNLCNSSIDFILKRDKSNSFLVGALQDAPGQMLLEKFGVKTDYLDSLVLFEDQKVYYRSTAALKISRHLSGLWPLFYVFILIPPFLRDPIYDWIGGNRYAWFGKKNTCRLPTEEERGKFLTLENLPILSED